LLDSNLTLDLKTANEQYGVFTLKQIASSHTRFLIVDNLEDYYLIVSMKVWEM